MKTFKLLMLSLISIFAPIKPIIIATFGLVLVDFILGVLAARHRGEAITSAGFRRTLSKLVIFEIAILAAFVTEVYLTGDIAPVQKMVTCFIGLTELTSIAENLNELSGGSLLKALVAKINSKNA